MTHTQDQLNHIYDHKLNPLEKKILNFCALLNEALTRTTLLRVLKNFKTVFPTNRIKNVRDLEPYCTKLIKLKLVNYELVCPDSIREDLALKASKDRNFQTMFDKITNFWPVQETIPGMGINFSLNHQRLIRDIRLALLSYNQDFLAQSIYLYYNKCSSNNHLRECLVRTCYHYFHNQIWDNVPFTIQLQVFCILLDYRNWRVKIDNLNVLDSALQLKLTENRSPSEYSTFICVLVKRLLMSANLKKAEEYLDKLEDSIQAQKLKAWLLFMQGKTRESVR